MISIEKYTNVDRGRSQNNKWVKTSNSEVIPCYISWIICWVYCNEIFQHVNKSCSDYN